MIAAVLLSIPVFLHDSLQAAVTVLTNYRSFSGVWGWTGILNVYHVTGRGYAGPGVDAVQHVGTLLTVVALAAVIACFWRAGAVPLTAAVLLAFLAVTAGFGVQYLLWSIPFVLLLRRRSGLVFAALASLYAGYAYHLAAGGSASAVGAGSAGAAVGVAAGHRRRGAGHTRGTAGPGGSRRSEGSAAASA